MTHMTRGRGISEQNYIVIDRTKSHCCIFFYCNRIIVAWTRLEVNVIQKKNALQLYHFKIPHCSMYLPFHGGVTHLLLRPSHMFFSTQPLDTKKTIKWTSFVHVYFILYFLFLNQCYRTCRFSQFLNFVSSLPNSQVKTWRAFMLALTTPLLLYQCELDSLSRWAFANFNLIWLRIPTRSSSTLWLIPTEISINFARYVQAIHLPSETRKEQILLTTKATNACYFTWCNYTI